MMKRIVAILFFASIALAALALLAPGFIDWSRHKDQIVAQLEPYIGRRIEVGGKVSFRIIPNPRLELEDVSLDNAEGSKTKTFMKLKRLEADVKFQPLLQGRFDISDINLAEPDVNLEVLDDGSNNWTDVLKERPSGTRLGDMADTVQLNRVSMTGGTLHYANHVTGAEWQVEDLNLAVQAETLFGPYNATGDMRFRDTPVAISVKTGAFGKAPVQLRVALRPESNFPEVDFDGTADLSAGLSMEGDLTIGKGSIASLFDNGFLNGIGFLGEEADFDGTLKYSGAEAKIDGIKAKIGKKGQLSGAVTVDFAKDKKPLVTADLDGANLKITGKPVFMATPGAFDARLKLKGRGITWNGMYVPGITVTADTDKDEWVVKNVHADMPGKSVLKLAGVLTPRTGFAGTSIEITTENLPQLLKAMHPADGSPFRTLQDSGVVTRLDLSASLDIKKDQFSFSDIEAAAGGMKMTGVLNVARGGGKPAFSALLNLDNADIKSVPDGAWASFVSGLMKSTADIEVIAKNVSAGGLKVADMTLRGKIDDKGLSIREMNGHLQPAQDGFSLGGAIASFNPATGMDLLWQLRTQDLAAVAQALGVEIPPPLDGKGLADLHGKVAGAARKYDFTLEGKAQDSDVSVSGSAAAEGDSPLAYKETVKIGHATWAALGLPVDKLLGAPGDVAGDLAGTRADWKIAGLNAGGASGWVGRKDGRSAAALAAPKADFDAWVSGWSVPDGFTLSLKAKKMLWRDDTIEDASMQLDAGPSRLRLSGLRGGLWGGALQADIDSQRKDGVWKGTLKGNLDDADLGMLADKMGVKGVAAGHGNLAFDLASDSAKGDKQWFGGVDGTVTAHIDPLTVRSFSPSALPDLLEGYKQPPDDLAQQMTHALASAPTTYKNVDASFTVGGGKIKIDGMKLVNLSSVTDVTGALDLSPDTYDIAASVQLKSPAGVPAFRVTRAGPLAKAKDYAVAVKPVADYLVKKLPPPAKVVDTAPPAEPPPAVAPPDEALQPPPGDDQSAPEGMRPPQEYEDDNVPAQDAPVDTEPLQEPVVGPQPQVQAPAPPPPPETEPGIAPPPPEQPAPPKNDAIKGIMDRLDAPDEKPDDKKGDAAAPQPEKPAQ